MAEAGRHSTSLFVNTSQQVEAPNLQGHYVDLKPYGYGSNGLIYSAQVPDGSERVVVKPVTFSDKRHCQQALREIRILRQLCHENVVTVKDLLMADGQVLDEEKGMDVTSLCGICIIQEMLDTNLHSVICSGKLTEPHIQWFTYQILRGLKYIHSANIVHRDLKPANLLINCNDLTLKVADFGVARIIDANYSHKGQLTASVGTCWYRAPEAILSPRSYGKALDLWSAGCILAEMYLGYPLLQGNNDLDQLLLILDAVHMTDDDWGRVLRVLPNKLLKNHPLCARFPLTTLVHNAHADAVDLMEDLLTFDPKIRPTSQKALGHHFISQYNDPTDEPVARRPFAIEHEVDAVGESALKVLVVDECLAASGGCGSYSGESSHCSVELCPADSPLSKSTEDLHTLEEIFSLASDQAVEFGGAADREVGEEEADTKQHKHSTGCYTSESVVRKNLKNSQRREAPVIINKDNPSGMFYEKNCEIPQQMVEGKLKTVEREESDEKETAEISDAKLEEDRELISDIELCYNICVLQNSSLRCIEGEYLNTQSLTVAFPNPNHATHAYCPKSDVCGLLASTTSDTMAVQALPNSNINLNRLTNNSPCHSINTINEHTHNTSIPNTSPLNDITNPQNIITSTTCLKKTTSSTHMNAMTPSVDSIDNTPPGPLSRNNVLPSESDCGAFGEACSDTNADSSNLGIGNNYKNNDVLNHKEKLKATHVTKYSISRKLILDKIQTEKEQAEGQSGTQNGLTSEELDNLYRLPTDHLEKDQDDDTCNQRLKHKRVTQQLKPRSRATKAKQAVHRPRAPNNHNINEVIKGERLTLEGACGGIEHSPEGSDVSSDPEDLHNISLSLQPQLTLPHPTLPITASGIEHYTSSTPPTPAATTLPSCQSNEDTFTSPQCPPITSPNHSQATGARPKKSPKKQKAL